MKYLNIKKTLAAWQELQPLSEKDRERLCRLSIILSFCIFFVALLSVLMAWLKKYCSKQNNKSMKSEQDNEKKKEAETNNLKVLCNNAINNKKVKGNAYDNKCLLGDVEQLMPHFPQTYCIIAELCKNLQLTEGLGNKLLYCGFSEGRHYRILMFVLLYNETANLKNDAQLGYRLFREAYLMTDNIYGQLQNTTYSFVLKDYLTELEKSLGNRILNEFLNVEEKKKYDTLSDKITVFRGMCDGEKQSGQYGISWTLDKNYARNYVFYEKNDVKGTVGWIAEMDIDKKDIFAVWGVDGKEKEIVINPTKCNNVNFVIEKK
ncbi:MAG: hypothetical protein J6M59_12970 [Bacteroidaceae bacterium]|nr:hypothetical protein [Bacteroidaceae bacterium]